jgi:hypothetical protein
MLHIIDVAMDERLERCVIFRICTIATILSLSHIEGHVTCFAKLCVGGLRLLKVLKNMI